MTQETISPAEQAARACMDSVISAIDTNSNFLVEAGAGAGKTYTLIRALKHLIKERSSGYLRTNKRIACITYTNIAKDEIKSRTDNHPVVFAETIHAFCWELIKDFQKPMRMHIHKLTDNWKIRVDEVGNLGEREVIYNLGYPKITDSEIFLHHDDVIKLMVFLLEDKKFKKIITSKFPIIFIDEYQDTNKDLADSIVRNFIETKTGPMIGFFGDHWQKIYGSKSCGLITASDGKMIAIGKKANFRSDKLIVEALNKIRPELKQHVSDPESTGEIIMFHSNGWTGGRRTDNHWQGDLPEMEAHTYLERTQAALITLGWNITPESTKILMLTNNVLANEQGYLNLFRAFPDSDDFLKKSDDYMAFLTDIVEPGSEAFLSGKYGEMLKTFNMKAPIRRHTDKQSWHNDMTQLIELRKTGNIGAVIDCLKTTQRPKLIRRIEEKERDYATILRKSETDRTEQEINLLSKIQNIRSIPYTELINVGKYIDDKTLFSTKHGVKGAEFENVLIVFGRGWNNYNWNQMLEWVHDGIPNGKQETYERNRNLFYVACSRPKNRLAMLFTQKLSDKALTTLTNWFGSNIQGL